MKKKKVRRKEKVKSSHFEIFYLLKFFRPFEIVKYFGYPRTTVYLYSWKLRDAKKIAIEILKRDPRFSHLNEIELERLLS